MATGATAIYDLPFPLLTDTVNVHGDIQSLAEQIELVLPSLGLPYFTYEVKNSSGVTINKGDPVYATGYSTKTTVAKSDSDNLATFPVIGLAQSNISNGSDGVIIVSGIFSGNADIPLNTSSYTAGDVLYVANGGGLTDTQPEGGSGAVAVVLKANASTGAIVVGQPKGNGTWGSMKAGLA
jgi:predicted RecA/RadA family phage recombinase